jgi:hypothetical protein
MSVLRMFMCLLTVFMSRNSMLFSFFVLSHFVMMNSFPVVMCRCVVMPGCIVVVLAGRMFHRHWMRPFDKNVLKSRRSSLEEDSRKTLVRV